MSIDSLIARQNQDGGWPYVRGNSWMEPTVYAVLALHAAGATDEVRRGIQWIVRLQRADGGWPPQAGVDESTWVTALAAILPPDLLGPRTHDGAIGWLMNITGQESTSLYRVRQWLLGNNRPPDQEWAGWPWFPGAAAWVGPTALAIVALDRHNRRHPSTALQTRIDEGRGFLLARMCREGGWNHGSARALGYDARPYPETTGMALTALRGVRKPEIEKAVSVARRFAGNCRSADALNWLKLGLLAHGDAPPASEPVRGQVYRTIAESSLALLVDHAQTGQFSF
jgi:hypothetical protein